MADFLLELFSEEIPARMQHDAAQHLASAFEKALKEAGLSFASASLTYFVTPRRLAISLQGLPLQQQDIATERKGPKADAPQVALDGFLKSTGLTLAQLENRAGVYFATLEQKGKPTAALLRAMVEKILLEFPWPKSMRWGNGETRWVRPLQNILCLFDGKVVPVQFAGLTANQQTFGHRFLAPEAIQINEPVQYEAQLLAAHVIVNREARKAHILQQAEALAAKQGLRLKDDAGLLEEVTGLVEWPVVLMGRIDDDYMHLPPEVLVSEMRAHQKYFALLNADGSLSPYFLITANITAQDGGKAIIAGNERVLRARFADGRFFWEQDRKTKLEDWAKGLEHVTYHARLGSVAAKMQRVEKLATVILSAAKNPAGFFPTAEADLIRATRLSKADLVTGMVGEFPELQGIMGRYYALAQGESAEIADAIRDHYKPQGPTGSVPNAPLSICLALADKLETLTAMFAIGEKPTGSKDPFALRRAALGVIRIVLENNVSLYLLPLFTHAPFKQIALLKAHAKLADQAQTALTVENHKVGKYLTLNETASEDIAENAAGELAQELLAFFHDRLRVMLKDEGTRPDIINAVLENDDDMRRISHKAQALQALLTGDDGVNLLAAYKRAANILGIEEKKDKTSYAALNLKREVLKEPAELALVQALDAIKPTLQTALNAEDFENAMQHLSHLRAPLDAFFDDILVNTPDAAIRHNRLCLLAAIKATMEQVADFGKIEG